MVLLLPFALGLACSLISWIGSNSDAVRALNRVLWLLNLICPGIAFACAVIGVQAGKEADLLLILIVAVGAPFGIGWLVGSLATYLLDRFGVLG